ncbi:MAG: HAD-IIB family hydrolase [Thermodesulfobacteriota bacterium]
MQIIIFTDLDGTLLNHDDYSFEEARPSLERIKRNRIPLVITTSKTRAEVELIQRELGIEEPFIVENGAAVFFPLGYPGVDATLCEIEPPYALIKIGRPYAEIRAFVQRAGAAFEIRGFGDLTSYEVARLAGMSLEKARLAKEREFSEPFLIPHGVDVQTLQDLTRREGMKILKGGRFHHLVGMHQDKGEAVRIARKLLSGYHGDPVTTVGLGDSPNDEPMLREVDVPVLIPLPDGSYENINLPGLRKATFPGSKGWQESVERLLDEVGA